MSLLPRDKTFPLSPYSAASELSYDEYSSTPSGHHPGTTTNTLDQSQSYSIATTTQQTTTTNNTTRPHSRDRSADMYSYLKTLLNGSGAEKDLDQAVKSLMGNDKSDDETLNFRTRRTTEASSEPDQRMETKLTPAVDEDARRKKIEGKTEERNLPALTSSEGESMNEDTLKPRKLPKPQSDNNNNHNTTNNLTNKNHREEVSISADKEEEEGVDESNSFVRPKSLMDLSNLLVTSGFPPLSSAVVAEEVSSSAAEGRPILTGSHVANLVTSMTRVISEYRRRGVLIQQMTEKIAAVEKRIQKQNERRAERAEQKENARNVEFQKVLKAAEEQTEAVRKSLSTSEAEASPLRERCAQLEDLLKKQREETETARREHSLLVRKNQQNQQRNEQTFQGIMREFTKHRRDPSKAPIDRLTLEVIDVYERKLDDLNQKLEEARKRTSTIPAANRSSDGTTTGGQTHDDEKRTTIRLVDDLNETSDFSVSQKPLQEKITYLKARLDDTTERLKETEKKIEVLKLQVLSQKKPIAGLSTPKVRRTDKSHFGTLDMIKRDKLTYKLRLWRVDELELEECRACIKDILVKLRLDEVTSLLSVIDDIVRVVRLVPQMERFITSIDELVWGPYGVNANDENEKGGSLRPPPHKLTETERTLYRWRDRMNGMDSLLVFRRAVHHALRIAESNNSRSDKACLEELRRLMNKDRVWIAEVEDRRERERERGDGEDDYVLLSKYVKHFCDLFEVDSMDGVLPRISQLYQYVCEVDTGLRRLRDVLKFDGKCSPGKTLSSAARILEELTLAEDEPPADLKTQVPTSTTTTTNGPVDEEFDHEPSYGESFSSEMTADDDRMYDPGSPRETRNVIYGIEHDDDLRPDRRFEESQRRENTNNNDPPPLKHGKDAVRSTEHMNVDEDEDEDFFTDDASLEQQRNDEFRQEGNPQLDEQRSFNGTLPSFDADPRDGNRNDDSTSQVLRSLTALRSRLGS